MEILFTPGAVRLTPGAADLLETAQVAATALLRRHLMGDWGDVDKHDRAENDFSVLNGYRILSAYDLGDQRNVWIITEADRSSTTILLPEEY